MSPLHILLVAAGSALGGTMRYLVGLGVIRVLGDGFPWGTLIVNLTGSFALGAIFSLVHEIWTFHPGSVMGKLEWRLFLAVGITGGYTTFSSFELDNYELFRHGRAWAAIAYIAASVAVGLVAFRLGMLSVGGE